MFRSCSAAPPRRSFRYRSLRLLAAAVCLLAGCSQLPSAAPNPTEFQADAAPAATAARTPPTGTPRFLVVGLDAPTLALLAATPPANPAGRFDAALYTPSLRLRPGDLVGVTLFDLGAVPLFGGSVSPTAGTDVGAGAIPAGAHGTALPPQPVEADGSIAIPFAGRVHVGGLTPLAAGERIVAALAGRATTPQAVVSLVGASLDTATVGGDVARPALVPLTLRGERILDALAAAGGSRYEPFNCDVQLTRHGRIARISLQRIVDDPSENLVLEPGDSLFVLYAPRSFLVLGAALRVARYEFDTERMTLAEAVARAGGPNEILANLSQLYLLRTEPPAVARRLLAGDPNATALPDQPLPVAYRLDLRHGSGYFIAQQMQMRDKDVVLMTNANEVQLQKFFGIVRDVTGVYFDLHSRY